MGCSEINALGSLHRLISRISEESLSVSLTFNLPQAPPLRLIFKLGRVVWATGGEHRFRRWSRLKKALLPSLTTEVSSLCTTPASLVWEYQLLMLLLRQRCISRDCAAQFIQACLHEVLFEIVLAYSRGSQSVEIEHLPECKTLEPLIFPVFEPILSSVEQDWNTWCAAGLAALDPNQSPRIVDAGEMQQRTSPKTYQNLRQLLCGRLSLRELALVLKQELFTLTYSLWKYEQQQLLVFDSVPDASAPWLASLPSHPEQMGVSVSHAETPKNAQTPLIYCIDDVDDVCQSLGLIARNEGYRFESTQDSIQALQAVIEHKPDLIFIDLVMPIMSGYEVCTQIRRVAAFQDTPLVILTGNDGVVDRVRSKIVGATEFASKPVSMDKILPILQKYVPLATSKQSVIAS